MVFNLPIIDIGVIVSYLALVVALGIWTGRNQVTVSDYFLGRRSLPWWAILGSIVATETSTATFLSVPGVAFNPEGGDLRFLQLALGYIVGRFLVVWLMLPMYFRGQLFTAYEVLQYRFGRTSRRAASVLFLITRNAADGLRLYLAAIVLEQVSNLNLPWCVLILGFATVVYTVFGGIRSVVWNDCVQLLVYLMGAILAAALILERLPGGWSEFLAFGHSQHKFRLWDFALDFRRPYTLWAGLIGGVCLTMATHGTDHLMVQRLLSARNQRDAGTALMVSGLVVLVQFLLFLGLGVGFAAYQHSVRPEAVLNRNDEVFAWFIAREMPSLIRGLTLAAVFAAAMSTLSSSLNASASSTWNDLIRPLLKDPVSDRVGLYCGRWLTVLFGCLQIGVGLWARQLDSSVVTNVLAIAGLTSGVVLGLFLLGITNSHVREPIALAAAGGGLVAVVATWFGTSIAWPWYALIGCAVTIGLGVIGARLARGTRWGTPRRDENP